jgi:hypothetical protein
LNLSVRKAARFDRGEGVVVGFAPEQWQVEAAKDAPKRRAATNGNGQHVNGAYQNGQPSRAARAERAGGGPTAEASSATVAPPVNGDAARIAITIYETENEVHDQALLRSVVALLNDAPGKDQVRLVIHDAEGQELEFDLPSADVNERLAESVRAILKTNGTVAVNGARSTAA